MKVLFWIPPWAAQGDPVFYRNCLKKHLALQANILAVNGWSIDFVLPEFLSSERNSLDQGIKLINFSIADQIATFGTHLDQSLDLYMNGKEMCHDKIISHLSTKLDASYDIILIWETPVPFLEKMYPDALIVHQMPGAFSRAPYPHTVTFDPIGLYKHGSLYLNSNDIQKYAISSKNTEATSNFIYHARDAIKKLQPFEKNSLILKNKFERLVLLPLQISGHYAFQADTKYKNQTEFLLDVLNRVPLSTGVVVTQYVTPRVSDTVLNKEILPVLRRSYPNLIYREEFNRMSNVSQFLLPLVDEVITCSSSIGLQALIWPRKLTVFEDTFLYPLATPMASAENFDEFERSLRILSFLLNQNQPLYSSVVNDRGFLTGILLEMLRLKREGKKGLDLMPRFVEIDPDYPSKLLASFALERAELDLIRTSDRWSSRQTEIAKFRRSVFDPEVTTVTFDIFDTLIKRPTELPSDVYKFLENTALEITNGVAEDFARVRSNAEASARELSNKGEITLNEIYMIIKDHYRLSEQTAKNLLDAEIEMEVKFIQPRPFGQKCWEIAVSSNKPIYLISDMYLPCEVIERMLQKAGYQGYKKLFLSSEYGLSKKDGDLFDAVLSEIKELPYRVLHIGDNKIADVEKPQSRGIKTYRLLRAVDRMRGNDHYKLIYPSRLGQGERARSSIAGLIAQTLFDIPSGQNEKTSHFHGDPYRLGYAGLGPLITGFMMWLGREAKRDQISCLYFLSREGWILKQVYDALHLANVNAIPSSYLYASRRATRVAGLLHRGDVLAISGHPYKSGIAVGELLRDRFGLVETALITEVMLSCGYPGWTTKLDSDSASRVKFSKLCEQLTIHILDVAKRERDCYLNYLGRAGFTHSGNPGVVDVGWKGSMQDALSNLIGRPIHGYYYATLQGAEVGEAKGNMLRGYMGVSLSNNHPSVIVANRAIFEYLTCHVEPTLIRIDQSGDDLIPIFRSEQNYGDRRQFVEEVHQGCIQFANDYRGEFNNFKEQISIDPFLSERVLASFINSPSKADAEFLFGHNFEDAFGGNGRQYIIHPNQKVAHLKSVWKQGAEVLLRPEDTSPAPIKKHENIKSSNGRSIENFFVRFISDKKKYQKYRRSREEFFLDSTKPFMRFWFLFNR